MNKEMIKPFALGIGVGAIVLLIVIFSAGWVVTSGSAQAKAEQMAGQAVVDRLAPICVAQFLQDPNKEKKLKELKKLDTYGMKTRGNYVEEQGWATMPGQEEPDSKVAAVGAECARRIVELEK